MQENPTFISENAQAPSQKPFKQEKARFFMLSVALLAIVLIFGGAMTILRFTTEKSIESVNQKISETQWKITQLQTDKSISIASKIASNTLKTSIDIKKLVADFKAAAIEAWVQFQGFSVKDNEISTNLIARSDNSNDAVSSIIAMMQKYSQNNSQKAFDLEPILSIAGTPQSRTTPVTFKIISSKSAQENTNSAENSQNSN